MYDKQQLILTRKWQNKNKLRLTIIRRQRIFFVGFYYNFFIRTVNIKKKQGER